MVKFISRLLCDHAQTVWIKSPAFQKSYLWCSFFLSSINCFFICLVIFWEVFLVNKLLKLLFHTHQGGKEKKQKTKVHQAFFLSAVDVRSSGRSRPSDKEEGAGPPNFFGLKNKRGPTLDPRLRR